MSLNDISSNAFRIEIAEKVQVACDRDFTNIFEILIERMIGLDMNSKFPEENGGLLEALEARVKEL